MTTSLKNNQIANAPQAISNGYYTLVYANGAHRTFRIKAWKGQQMIGFLSGSDNETSYTYFGVLDTLGNLKIWYSYKQDKDELHLARLTGSVRRLIAGKSECGKAYAMASKNCYRCNRLLTHPESLETGIGPECRKKI